MEPTRFRHDCCVVLVTRYPSDIAPLRKEEIVFSSMYVLFGYVLFGLIYAMLTHELLQQQMLGFEYAYQLSSKESSIIKSLVFVFKVCLWPVFVANRVLNRRI
jgi:hypothetical protein